MQFIYLGKAMFYETRISEFLKVSKYLGIKYLSTVIEMNDQTNSNDKETNEHANNAADEDVGAEDPTQTFNEDVANVEHTVNIPIIRNKSAIKKVSRTDGGKYACKQCDYQAGYLSHLTTHIQSVHEGVKYACNQCDHQATQQGDLTKHMKRNHCQISFMLFIVLFVVTSTPHTLKLDTDQIMPQVQLLSHPHYVLLISFTDD